MVRNLPVVPLTDPVAPGDDRVVYIGSITLERGAAEMAALGHALRDEGITVELIGPGRDAATRRLLEEADAAGDITWHGALAELGCGRPRCQGALAGLSLLHDLPNYRQVAPHQDRRVHGAWRAGGDHGAPRRS